MHCPERQGAPSRPHEPVASEQRALEAVLAGDFDMVLAEEFPGAPMPFAEGLEVEEVCRDPLLLAVPDGWDPDDLAADLCASLPDALVRVVDDLVELAVPTTVDLSAALAILAPGRPAGIGVPLAPRPRRRGGPEPAHILRQHPRGHQRRPRRPLRTGHIARPSARTVTSTARSDGSSSLPLGAVAQLVRAGDS